MEKVKITKISMLNLHLMTPDSHQIIVNTSNIDRKRHQIILQVGTKNYNLEKNSLVIKNPQQPVITNAFQALLQGNNSLRVKAFIYDFVDEKIVEAKLQEFGLQAQQSTTATTSVTGRLGNTSTSHSLMGYVPIDDLLTTVPVILGWEKPKATIKRKILNITVSNGKAIDGLKKEFTVDVFLDHFDFKNTDLPNTQSIEIEIDKKNFKAEIDPNEANHWRADVYVVFNTVNLLNNSYTINTKIVSTLNFTQESYLVDMKMTFIKVMVDGNVYEVVQEDKSSDGNSLNGTNCDDMFKKIAPIILEHEGGYKNEPLKDKGDPTNKGISWPIWEKYAKIDLGIDPTKENQKNLTNEQATIIYKKHYWEPKGYCEMSNLKVALMIYDWTITSGGAVKEVQKLLKNVYLKEIIVDGTMGSKTVKIINSIDDQKELLGKIAEIRILYYEKGATAGWFSTDYLKGLKNRVTKCLNYEL